MDAMAAVWLPRDGVCEGDNPLTLTKKRQLGTLAIVALVALRVGIGWHFFREGTVKIQQDDFSSAGFLSTARGPFSGFFQGLVWDADGSLRLGYDSQSGTVSSESTAKRWNDYRVQVVNYYDLDENQQDAAQDLMERRLEQLEWYFDNNGEDILRYFQQLERLQLQKRDASRREVSTLRGQSESLAREVYNSRRGWLAAIGRLEREYQSDLAELAELAATEEQQEAAQKMRDAQRELKEAKRSDSIKDQQRAQRKLEEAKAQLEESSRQLREEEPFEPLQIKYSGRRFYDSKSVDRFLPYFDMVIGVCLVIGLLTSTTAIAGACFLLTVMLSQFPGAEGAAPVYYQGVEALGLCLVAALRAGQYGGLDFFTHCLWRRSKRPKQGAKK